MKKWRWVKTEHLDGHRSGDAILMPDGSLWRFYPAEDVAIVRGKPDHLDPIQEEIVAFPEVIDALERTLKQYAAEFPQTIPGTHRGRFIAKMQAVLAKAKGGAPC